MMGDRISTLPDAVLCHILSFLPTKQAVATSVLSKRWNPLWRSVPTLDFDDQSYVKSKEAYSRFVQSVYAVILSRDLHQPIQRFCLSFRRRSSSLCDPMTVNVWVNAAVQRRVEHLDLSVPWTWKVESSFNLPSAVLCCRTLVVLKLKHITVKAPPSVDLPSLKILHLDGVSFLERPCLAELLSGCPILEDLKAKDVGFTNSLIIEGEFKSLPELVRAHIYKPDIPLEAVSNVEFLRIDGMDYAANNEEMDLFSDEEMDVVNDEDTNHSYKDHVPVFHNLTHIELTYLDYTKDWHEVIEVLKHCPKLQILVIDKEDIEFFPEEEEEGADWTYPQSVPKCISLRLKTCCLNNYKGSKGEFRFARYIMRNARLLQTMTISCNTAATQQQKLKMIIQLSLCKRRSATCKLSVKNYKRRFE